MDTAITRRNRFTVTMIVVAAMAWSGSFGPQSAQLAAAEPDVRPLPARGQGEPPPAPPGRAQRPGDSRPAGPPGMQRAIDELKLSDEQKFKIDPIVQAYRQKQQQAREEFLKEMKQALNPQQYEAFESAMTRRPPAPPPQANRDAETPPANAPAASSPAIAPDAAGRIAVTFTGGYDTDPRDHGRPVALIAAALNVTPEIFRDAFSRVTPASGGREPEPAQVRLNKQALMASLTPYGITNDRLDAVSNYYRYNGSKGQMWRNTPATAYATIRNGVVTITISNPGAGYSSPPKISITGMPGVNATATLSFGTDFAKNGSIKEITVGR